MSESKEVVKNVTLSYSSISEIHNALLRNTYSPRELFDYLQDNYNEWVEEEDLPEGEKKADLIRGSEGD